MGLKTYVLVMKTVVMWMICGNDIEIVSDSFINTNSHLSRINFEGSEFELLFVF